VLWRCFNSCRFHSDVFAGVFVPRHRMNFTTPIIAKNQNGSASTPSSNITDSDTVRGVRTPTASPATPSAFGRSNKTEYRLPATAGAKRRYAATMNAVTHCPTNAESATARTWKARQHTATRASAKRLAAPIGAAFAVFIFQSYICLSSIMTDVNCREQMG